MDVKEKIIDILENSFKKQHEKRGFLTAPNTGEDLIANGVTVQEDCKDCAEATQNCIVKLQEQISELRSAHEWISVDDRLPVQPPNRVDEQGRSWFTPDIDCIVYDGENVFAAHYCFPNKCFWYADTLHPLKNITNWMPMPQPPKGE